MTDQELELIRIIRSSDNPADTLLYAMALIAKCLRDRELKTEQTPSRQELVT